MMISRPALLGEVRANAYTIPTDGEEGDGTYTWNSTTIVIAEVEADGQTGLGYSYTDRSAALIIRDVLGPVISGCEACAISRNHERMLWRGRNLGKSGLVATAISAVDTALWDLKAKILGMPLCLLLGPIRDRVSVYGSGGFTTYSIEELQEQLGGWVDLGLRWVKMKVGADPRNDVARVKAARAAIGEAGLFVDANGAYSCKQALAFADKFAQAGVEWFEEPVSSDDLEGLRFVRERAPARMEVAAGEYGYDAFYFQRMLDAKAVDVLQADATRCLGVTGLLLVDALCVARGMSLSLHCAPALHLPAALCLRQLRHQEWFHDHVRIEHMMFDGAPSPRDGMIVPDLQRPGLGLELKTADIAKYRA